MNRYMPDIEKICSITGKPFIVSEREQELLKSFGAELPDISPVERMRYLMCFRNTNTLYQDTCDLCGKATLSLWGSAPAFPVYCKECWYSDKWSPPAMDVDIERSFFDQLNELVLKSPHLALATNANMVNSDYCNAASNLKNCYMSFNIGESEDCYYVYVAMGLKNSLDAYISDNAEFLYDALCCHGSYKVFWSEFALNCTDSFFLYDCVDCSDCTLSTGLRHKQYVYANEQLTKEVYEAKISDLKKGSYRTLEEYRIRFNAMKHAYTKKCIISRNSQDVSGNFISNSQGVEQSYFVTDSENCVNVFNVWPLKDSLDICAFGIDTQRCFFSAGVGSGSSEITYSFWCYESCSNMEYSMLCLTSNNCFGCSFGRNFAYSILNRQYEPEEYKKIVAQLKEKMKERGEYGKLFRPDMVPFAYNESIAQLNLPLSKEEALSRGFRWADRPVQAVSSSMIYTPPDTISEVQWADLTGKVIVCEETGRPFKIIKQEFDFYKKFNIPLPRLHWEARLARRYPQNLLFDLYDAPCSNCGVVVQTSMPDDEKIFCESCYQKAVV